MVTPDYTVKLEQVFQGPMDLLLHLVREQEVDIHEIEINRVIDGYLGYLKQLQEIDIELAGDFLVLAATLMAIKSRSLLPSDEIDLAQELDPRDELIQRLIEYRRFKQASRDLQERFDERSRIFERGFQGGIDAEPTLDLSELSNWDLLSAFSRLMRETLANKQMVITSDEQPLRFYVEKLVRTIKDRRQMTLRAIVEEAAARGGASKRVLIGTFCALLELIKLGAVRAHQASKDADITIALRDDLGDDVERIVQMTEFDDERPPVETPEPGAAGEEHASVDAEAPSAPPVEAHAPASDDAQAS